MLVRLVHFQNAELPMLVTLFGIVTLVSPRQSENALASIIVTLSGITTDVDAPLYFSSTPARITKSAEFPP